MEVYRHRIILGKQPQNPFKELIDFGIFIFFGGCHLLKASNINFKVELEEKLPKSVGLIFWGDIDPVMTIRPKFWIIKLKNNSVQLWVTHTHEKSGEDSLLYLGDFK